MPGKYLGSSGLKEMGCLREMFGVPGLTELGFPRWGMFGIPGLMGLGFLKWEIFGLPELTGVSLVSDIRGLRLRDLEFLNEGCVGSLT